MSKAMTPQDAANVCAFLTRTVEHHPDRVGAEVVARVVAHLSSEIARMTGPTDDGGPAFPSRFINNSGGPIGMHSARGPVVTPQGSEAVILGLTVRDYFIARAPAEVPEWFCATMDRECPVVPSINSLPVPQRRDIEVEWDSSEGTPWAKQWCADRAAAEKAQAEWQEEFRRECVFQWPLAWADEMLKRRRA